MIWLRIYLLAGLVLHKVVWEALKRPTAQAQKSDVVPSVQPARLKFVKAVKIAILLGIVAQTMLPDLLPISVSAANVLVVRLTGVVIFTVGLATALLGRLHLGANWSDIETARVLRNQAVVTHGLYGYIRHPIYVGDLLLLVGLELSLNSWLVLLVCLLAPVVLWKAVREERMLAVSLPGYAEYCGQTKRFIPFVV